MNISALAGKQKISGRDVKSRAIKSSTDMVTNGSDDKEQKPSHNRLTIPSDRLNGYTVLQETPIISRLIVKRDLHGTTTTTNDNSLDDILPLRSTTTFYKCHLCCSVCPTLYRMRCHLVFHCRKESLKCLSFKVTSNHQDPDLANSDTKQESEIFQTMENQDGESDHPSTKSRTTHPSSVAENLSLNKNHTNQSELRPNDKCGSESSSNNSAGVERDASTAYVSGSYENFRNEKMKVTPGMDSRNSATYSGVTSRKRSFSINDDYRNSFKHINEVDEKNECKKFSSEQNCITPINFAQNQERNYFENGNFEFGSDSKFKPFKPSGFDNANLGQKGSKSPISERNNVSSYTNGLSVNGYEALTERCALPQNVPPFYSPYYWLARQQWLNLNKYPEISHQDDQARSSVQNNQTPPLKNTSTEMGRKQDAGESKATSNVHSPPLSPDISPPAPSPSKSPTPSADSSSSSPLASTSFHFYNPVELIKIMRNLAAYPNFLPPVYPFFSMPTNLLNYPTESTYKSIDNQLSDTEEMSHAYSSISSQPTKTQSSLSFDKSVPKNIHPYYPLLNFSPPSAYNHPPSKFIPDTGVTSSSSCMTSFNQSQFYKPAFSTDTNFHNTSTKTWSAPCDVKSSSDPVTRKDSKLAIFCKSEKSEVVKSSAKRGEACRPIKLADGRTVYHCSQCRKTFTNISDVNRHMDFHEDIRPFKCKFCSYYARTNSQLKVHMMRHQGIRQYVCHLCNYKGVTQSDLNRHTKSQIHVLKSRNECTQCSEGFVSPMNLAQHCKDRHHSSIT